MTTLSSTEQVKLIGTITRSVAKAQSSRWFKSEINTLGRSVQVFQTITAEIKQALVDAGVPYSVVQNVDPTDIIVGYMKADGYVLGDFDTAPLTE